MNLKHRYTPGLILMVLGFHGPVSAQAPATTVAEYTAAQSAEGKTAYDRACLQCHGRYLDDGQFAPPLRGTAFSRKWGGTPVDQLFTYVSTKMPPDAPGSLNARAYAAITAYIMQSNGLPPGVRELPSTVAALATLRIPGTGDRRGGAGGGLTPGVALPNQPPPNTLLDRITPVTDALLAKPPAGEWLTWRRTYDSQGYSPLKQIDRANVKNLRLAWSWSLPPGPNTATPLVHDGVMFVQGYGDIVEAIDAATGDLLVALPAAFARRRSPGGQERHRHLRQQNLRRHVRRASAGARCEDRQGDLG